MCHMGVCKEEHSHPTQTALLTDRIMRAAWRANLRWASGLPPCTCVEPDSSSSLNLNERCSQVGGGCEKAASASGSKASAAHQGYCANTLIPPQSGLFAI